jgi:hypothetical protein
LKKKRIKATNGCNMPFTAASFTADAQFFAYAFGYDWGKGSEFSGTMPVEMYIHKCHENEIKN